MITSHQTKLNCLNFCTRSGIKVSKSSTKEERGHPYYYQQQIQTSGPAIVWSCYILILEQHMFAKSNAAYITKCWMLFVLLLSDPDVLTLSPLVPPSCNIDVCL
uniref:Uncharacterized protein n=1 Tax=Astyanax mexicanus TaxID=7994 RepID=A0A3B1IQQ9_ASTMX